MSDFTTTPERQYKEHQLALQEQAKKVLNFASNNLLSHVRRSFFLMPHHQKCIYIRQLNITVVSWVKYLYRHDMESSDYTQHTQYHIIETKYSR